MKYEKIMKIYYLFFVLSLLLFLFNLLVQRKIIFTYEDSYGLVSKMNWLYWIGYTLSIFLVSFHFSKFKKIDNRYVFLTLSLLVLYLIGTPFFYEHLPRFEDTWGHSFLAQEMYKNEKVVNNLNIYEQYPGSFLFYGLLFKLLPSYFVMKFFPLFFYILGIFIIYILLKFPLGPKLSFLIVILYMFFNWTVEDNHISPQFLTLGIYFLFIFALFRVLGYKTDKRNYFILIILFTLVITFSHPLTPVFIILILGFILILCKNFREIVFVVFLIVFVSYILYQIFFTSMPEAILDHIKSFIENKPVKDVNKLGSFSSFSRQVFLVSRIGITLLSLLFGLIGLILLYKNNEKIAARFLFGWAIAIIPFVIINIQVLKGEFIERFVLISSLPIAIITGYLFDQYKTRGLIILLLLLLLSPVYFIAKYGNEAFESQSVEKLRADCFSSNFYSDCEERGVVVNSPLDYDIENLGERHFTVTREENMISSILFNKDINDIFKTIENISYERRLDRIYSTEMTGVYR